MTQREFLDRLDRRLEAAGIAPAPELSPHLWVYFQVLAKWNQKINLTGFPLDQPADEAIDRLFVEPVAAARHAGDQAASLIDIGSGGGSPAFPILLATSSSRAVLVESRIRKAVFLREAARELGIQDIVEVQNSRFEDVALLPEFAGQFDLLTVRAVRIEATELATMARFLKEKGQMFCFGHRSGDWQSEIPQLVPAKTVSLLPHLDSSLAILTLKTS